MNQLSNSKNRVMSSGVGGGVGDVGGVGDGGGVGGGGGGGDGGGLRMVTDIQSLVHISKLHTA